MIFFQKKILFYLSSIFSLLVLFPTHNWNNQVELVGHTNVSVSVGQNGDANASIPINIPKGTILQPSLGLSYNSQGGNGLVGLGWGLSGIFQSITRLPATMAQDGFIDEVDFDGNDRFALNGQRLVAVSGEYGANLTTYHTEQTNFSKIVSYLQTHHFRVWTKDGLILDFGKLVE